MVNFFINSLSVKVFLQRMVLIDVCRSRWAAWCNTCSHFYTAYVVIVKALEVNALGLHKDIYTNDVTSEREGKYRADSRRLLTRLEQFEFNITLLTVYQYLSHLEGTTIKVQSTSLNIVYAFRMVEEVKDVYQSIRKTGAIDFTKIYDPVVRIADNVEVQPAKPRAARWMRNRANAFAESEQECFLCNVAIPFLDHVITDPEAHFSPLSVISSTLVGLQ